MYGLSGGRGGGGFENDSVESGCRDKSDANETADQ